jgi:hypothetical protein
MLQTQPCVTADCDRCGQACWRDWDYQPHWPTETAALAELTTTGWRVTGTRLVCGECVAVLACQTHGHEFTPWQPCLWDPRLPGHPAHPRGGSCGLRYRSCERCGRCERTDMEHSTPEQGQEVGA